MADYPLHLIDYLFSALGALLSIGWVVLFYSLRKNADGVEKTAALALSERDKTAALVLSESKATAALVLTRSEATAALVLSEKDKLAVSVKAEHDRLEEKFNLFRIKVAEEYATTMLVEKILTPILKKMDEIEVLLADKVDRREFDKQQHQK